MSRPPNMTPAWWTVIPESLFGLAAISALEIAFFRLGEVSTIELHLYWVLVLLQSVRRGLRAGLVVALLAAAAYAALAVAMPWAMPPSYERLATESFFVMLVAMVTGDLRDRWRGRERMLTGRATELSDALDGLTAQYASASDVIGELGRRIAEQTVTVATLDTIARRLDVLDSAEVFPALLELLVHSMKAERASVYMLEGARLVWKAHVPASDPRPINDDIMDNELVRQAIASRAPRHIRSQLTGQAGGGIAATPVLLAAPLLDRLGEPVGVVTVEQIAFSGFNRSAVRFFDILVAWASRSLQNALLFEQVSAFGTSAGESASVLAFQQPAPLELASTGSDS